MAAHPTTAWRVPTGAWSPSIKATRLVQWGARCASGAPLDNTRAPIDAARHLTMGVQQTHRNFSQRTGQPNLGCFAPPHCAISADRSRRCRRAPATMGAGQLRAPGRPRAARSSTSVRVDVHCVNRRTQALLHAATSWCRAAAPQTSQPLGPFYSIPHAAAQPAGSSCCGMPGDGVRGRQRIRTRPSGWPAACLALHCVPPSTSCRCS